MSERYTRLFSLPAELYAPGAPLLVAAGALLLDNDSGRLVAQLKLKSLWEARLLAAKVRLQPLDTAGRPLGAPVERDYLDLNVARGGDFGPKAPIYLPDPVTRGFRVRLVEAVFEGGEVWSAPEEGELAPLPPAQPLEQALNDPELVAQLRLERGEDCRYLPERLDELWRCTCGEPVEGDLPCPKCGRSFFLLDLLDLARMRDLRLADEQAERERAAAEERERAEKKAAAKKKTGRSVRAVVLSLLSLVLVAALVLLGIPGALQLLADRAAKEGDYISAVSRYELAARSPLFTMLADPAKKVARLRSAARYQAGEEALLDGRYTDAVDAFRAAGGYGDAEAQLLVAQLGQAEQALAAGDYLTAYTSYVAVGKKAEDRELWDQCCLAGVKACAAADDVPGAEAAMRGISSRSTVRLEASVALAEAYLRAEKFSSVRNLLLRISIPDGELRDQKDSLLYQAAVGLYEAEQYSSAQDIFVRLADYEGAAHMAQLCQLGHLRALRDQGAYALFLTHTRQLDTSLLTGEELDSFSELLYDSAQQARSDGEYATAFTMFQMSKWKDYESKMAACNASYISTPKSLTKGQPGAKGATIYHSLDKYGELKDVTWIYADGKLTLELSYTANADLCIYLWSVNGNLYSTIRGPVGAKKGSSSYTLSFALSDLSGYSQLELELYYPNYNYWCGDSISLNPSTFKDADKDLYGDPIP